MATPEGSFRLPPDSRLHKQLSFSFTGIGFRKGSSIEVEAHWQKAPGQQSQWISLPTYFSPFLHICKVKTLRQYIFPSSSVLSETIHIFFGILFSSVIKLIINLFMFV